MLLELQWILVVIYLTADSGFTDMGVFKHRLLTQEQCEATERPKYPVGALDVDGDLIAGVVCLPAPRHPAKSLDLLPAPAPYHPQAVPLLL